MIKSFDSKKMLTKGGEKMRVLGIALALLCVTGVAASAVEIDMYIEPGWSTISCPVVPINPEPSAVFPLQYDAGAILRAGSGQEYDFFSQPDLAFGGILLGDGYFAYNDFGYTATCKIDGLEDGVPSVSGGPKTDMWISLPNAGWNLIGWPYNTEVTIDQDTGAPISFTDGQSVKTWAEATAAGWLSGDSMQYFFGGWNYTGYNYSYEDKLTPGKGYYIQTSVPNIAMIITAPAN